MKKKAKQSNGTIINLYIQRQYFREKTQQQNQTRIGSHTLTNIGRLAVPSEYECTTMFCCKWENRASHVCWYFQIKLRCCVAYITSRNWQWWKIHRRNEMKGKQASSSNAHCSLRRAKIWLLLLLFYSFWLYALMNRNRNLHSVLNYAGIHLCMEYNFARANSTLIVCSHSQCREIQSLLLWYYTFRTAFFVLCHAFSCTHVVPSGQKKISHFDLALNFCCAGFSYCCCCCKQNWHWKLSHENNLNYFSFNFRHFEFNMVESKCEIIWNYC